MAINAKRFEQTSVLRDLRPSYVRIGDWMSAPKNSFVVFLMTMMPFYFLPVTRMWADLIMIANLLFFWWLYKRPRRLPFRLPADSKFIDLNNKGAGRKRQARGYSLSRQYTRDV